MEHQGNDAAPVLAERPVGPAPEQTDTREANVAAAALLVAKELRQQAAPTAREDPNARANTTRTEIASITREQGVRPRSYRQLLDDPKNEAARRLVDVLPQVTKFVNDALRAAGSQLLLTPAEIATNFLSEGGVLMVNSNLTADVEGYYHAGLDSILDRYQRIKGYLHPMVRAACEDPRHHLAGQNEKDQPIKSLVHLSPEAAVYANGGMYAAAARTVELDLAKQVELARLPPEARVFWTTIYYNSGEGRGRELLKRHGVEWYKQAWKGSDDHDKNKHIAQFNAKLRVANFQLMWADLDGQSGASPF